MDLRRASVGAANFLLVLTGLASPATASALVERVRDQVVAIEAEWASGAVTHGFGFVVAEEDGRFVVATAEHVLRGRSPDATTASVRVRWFDAPFTPVPARALPTRANRIDLGVLVVDGATTREWTPAVLDPRAGELAPGEPLWFVGRSDDWYVPQLPGAVNRLSWLDDEIVADGLAVRPGTSGAPLLSERGIVGMIVRDADAEEVRATTITAIHHALREWRLPFQLRPADAPLDPPAGPVAGDCPDCPEIVRIDGGTFTMGSPPHEPGRLPDEGPRRTVEVAPFGLGRTEVTVAQYARFAEATGRPGRGCAVFADGRWQHDPTRGWRAPGIAQTPDDAVVCVSFDEAQAYADWLAAKTGAPYRLPSEAEWEFAARAGTTSPFHTGATLGPSLANVDGMAGGTAPVASYPANAWGLYDMHGNVWEWVADCWSPDHAGRSATAAARLVGPEVDCTRRVVRGGSWASAAQRARVAYRGANGIMARNVYLGFRVARDEPPARAAGRP